MSCKLLAPAVITQGQSASGSNCIEGQVEPRTELYEIDCGEKLITSSQESKPSR